MKKLDKKNDFIKKLLGFTVFAFVLIFTGCNFGNNPDTSSVTTVIKETTVLGLKKAEAADFINYTDAGRMISAVDEDIISSLLLTDCIWTVTFTNESNSTITASGDDVSYDAANSKITIPYRLEGEYNVSLTGTATKDSVTYELSGTGTYDFSSTANSPILIGLKKTEEGTGNFYQTVKFDSKFEYSEDCFLGSNFSAQLINLDAFSDAISLSTEISGETNELTIYYGNIPSGYYSLVVKWYNWKKSTSSTDQKDIELLFNEGNIVEIADNKTTSGTITVCGYNEDPTLFYATSEETADGTGQTMFNPAYVYTLLTDFASRTESFGTITINCSDFTADIEKVNTIKAALPEDSTIKIIYSFANAEADDSDKSYMTLSSSEIDVYKAIRITTSGGAKQLAVNTFTAYSDDSTEKMYIQAENGTYITAETTSPDSESLSIEPSFYLDSEYLEFYYATPIFTDNSSAQKYDGDNTNFYLDKNSYEKNSTYTYFCTQSTPYSFGFSPIELYISPEGTGNGRSKDSPTTLAAVSAKISGFPASADDAVLKLEDYTYDALAEHVSDNVSAFTAITHSYVVDMSDCTEITQFPAYAFANTASGGSSKMTGIKFPVGLTKIGDDAFSVDGDVSLTCVYVNSLADYLKIEFSNEKSCPFATYGYTCQRAALKNYSGDECYISTYENDENCICIPEGITEIKSYAFAWCKNIKKITCAENCTLEKICAYAFENNSNSLLTYVTIPASVYEIESNAFNISINKQIENVGTVTVTFEDSDSKWFYYMEADSTCILYAKDKENPCAYSDDGAFALSGNKHLIKQFFAVSDTNGSATNSGKSVSSPYADYTNIKTSISEYVEKMSDLSNATFDICLDITTDDGFTALAAEDFSKIGANVAFKVQYSDEAVSSWYAKKDTVLNASSGNPFIDVSKLTFDTTTLNTTGTSVTTPDARYYISTDNLLTEDKEYGIFNESDISLPEIDNYVFDGWFIKNEDSTYSMYKDVGKSPSYDVTLYARWTGLTSYSTLNMLWSTIDSTAYYNVASDAEIETTEISSDRAITASDYTFDIHGNAYVLTTDGKVNRYASGSDLTSTETTILTDISNGHIYCDVENDKLYVLDHHKYSGSNYYLYLFEISNPGRISESYSYSRLDTTAGAAEPLVATSSSTDSLVKKYSLSGVTGTSSCFAVNNNNLYRCTDGYIYIYTMSEDETNGYSLTCSWSENQDSYELGNCIHVFVDGTSTNLSGLTDTSLLSYTDMTIQNGALYLLFKNSSTEIPAETGKQIYNQGGIAPFTIDSSTGYLTLGDTIGWYGTSSAIQGYEGTFQTYQPFDTSISSAPYFFGPEKFVSSKYGKLVIADDGFFTTSGDSETAATISQINRVVTVDLSNNTLTSVDTTANFNADITASDDNKYFQ